MFIPLYLAFIVVTSSMVEYNDIEQRFMAVFVTAWIVVMGMPALAALSAAGPAWKRVAWAVPICAFAIAQHAAGLLETWPAVASRSTTLQIVSPELTAKVTAALRRFDPDRYVLLSNNKALLLHYTWSGGEAFVGNDANFLPSVLDEAAVAQWVCPHRKSLLLVIDGSFDGFGVHSVGEYAYGLLTAPGNGGWQREFSGQNVMIFSADASGCDCSASCYPHCQIQYITRRITLTR